MPPLPGEERLVTVYADVSPHPPQRSTPRRLSILSLLSLLKRPELDF
jgi:hypothetical protein